MRNIIFLILTALSFSVAEARDDEHLIPERSIFSDHSYTEEGYSPDEYYGNVLTVLNHAFKPETFGRVIVIPSFQNEYAVALSKKGEQFEVLYAVPDTHVWAFESLKDMKAGNISIVGDDDNSKIQAEIRELEAALPSSLADVKVDVCERVLPKSLGDKLYVLWGEMLYRTRYPDRRPISPEGDDEISVGFDGTTYHFSFDYDYPKLTGWVWSPRSESNTGRMVEIVELLKQTCLEINDDDLDNIHQKAENLLTDLSGSKY